MIPRRPIPVTEPFLLKLRWLIRIRWFAILGQATVTWVVLFVWRILLPVEFFLGVLALTTMSNVLAMILMHRKFINRNSILKALLLYDVLSLTALLWFSGGLYNPFKYMYLIYIALSALMLRSWWKWFLVVISVTCYAFLYWSPVPDDFIAYMRAKPIGEVAAFLVAVGFIFSSVFKLTQSLLYGEKVMQTLREKQWQSEKLNSLATLAGGAAHELATPLSTIAISAKELEKRLAKYDGFKVEKMDARLIRDEVKKCQTILRHMSTKSGELHGETMQEYNLEQMMAESASEYKDKIEIDCDLPKDTKIKVSVKTCTMVLTSLLKNAVQAEGSKKVLFKASKQRNHLLLEIQDFGEGMSGEVLQRIGEPFFSLKEPGQGMGLGVYIASAYIDSIGGEIVYDSIIGEGTKVTLKLPQNMIQG